MKKKHIIALISLLIFIVLGLGGYFLTKTREGKVISAGEIYSIPPMEKVFINGKIEPKKVENIFLDASKGSLDKVEVKNGDKVEKGDLLFTYKNEQIESQIEQLELQLNSLKAQKEELLKGSEDKKKQLEGLNNLNLENKEENLEENNIGNLKGDSLDNQIKFLEKQIKALKEKEYYKVLSPIKGNIILEESDFNPTKAYITIESGDYYIGGSVNEKDQPKIKEGQEANINILSTNENIKGKISLVGNKPIDEGASMQMQQGDRASSNMSYYEVKIVPENEGELTNGFHIQASVNLDKEPIEISKESIITLENESFVFKNVDGKLVKQIITFSPKEGSEDKVIVSSGLYEEDKIVSKPNPNMKEGLKVE